MRRSLAVIESPISAYVLALVCDNETEIDLIYVFNERNYNVLDVISVCEGMLKNNNICRSIVVSDGVDWSEGNRSEIFKSIPTVLERENIYYDKYDEVYANPFTSAYGLYFSTVISLSILTHGAIDYMRYDNMFYEKLMYFIKLRVWMKKPLKYYGLTDIKNPKKGYILVPQSEAEWDFPVPNLNAYKLESDHSKWTFCAWTEDFGYKESYSSRMIAFNAQLMKEFCDLNKTRITVLFLKTHRRSIQPSKKQRNNIERTLQEYVDKIIFVEDILESKYAKYMPAEILIQLLDIRNVIGSTSSVVWNCASMENISSYSFLYLGAKEVRLAEFTRKNYTRLNKLLRIKPYDFSHTIGHKLI
jgi:hypothetical protein